MATKRVVKACLQNTIFPGDQAGRHFEKGVQLQAQAEGSPPGEGGWGGGEWGGGGDGSTPLMPWCGGCSLGAAKGLRVKGTVQR